MQASSAKPSGSFDRQKVAAARLWATSRMPYLASAIFAAPISATEDIRTIAVDSHWRVRADPAVVERCTADELGKLLLHLIGHLVRDHSGRADHLEVARHGDPAAWNRAADAEINDDLSPFRLVPATAPDLPSDLGEDPGKLAEHYYRVADSQRRWDCGSGCDGQPRPWDEHGTSGEGCISSDQAGLLRLSVAAAIQEAAGQDPGSIAGGWLRWAEEVLPSKVDWRRLLAAEIRTGLASTSGAVDYTYRRPSRRRGVSRRVILPSLYRPLPEVAIVCDTSGSMHDELLARALAEVEGILTKAGLRRKQVSVLSVDTAVHAARRVTRASQVQLVGGGGTDMGAGIQAAVRMRPKPSTVVVLTDGFTPWPDTPPKGTRVVVGLLTQGWGRPSWSVPAWARAVIIE